MTDTKLICRYEFLCLLECSSGSTYIGVIVD